MLWQDTNAPEVHAASIFWVVTPCCVVIGYHRSSGTGWVKRVAACLSDTLVTYHNTTWCQNPEDLDLKIDVCSLPFTVLFTTPYRLAPLSKVLRDPNELCFWTFSIVWCLKNKQIKKLQTKD
jgi:hypothetical protein